MFAGTGEVKQDTELQDDDYSIIYRLDEEDK